MSYTIKYKNVHFPTWFYPTLRELDEKWQQKHAQGRKYIYSLTGDKLEKELRCFSEICGEEVGREAWPLYIRTIDLYENTGWPNVIITASKCDERGLALYHLAQDIFLLYDKYVFTDPEDPLNCILQISDKLRESLIINKFQYISEWSLSILEKLNIINSQQQAKYWEQRIFEGLTNNNVMFIKIACNWLEKKWISPIKHESEICKFVGQKIWPLYMNHQVEDLKPKLLHSIYKYPSVYRKAAALYDEQVRRHNLECFKYYKNNGNDPSDFKGLPFADGSSMKPVRRWFSWKLEYPSTPSPTPSEPESGGSGCLWFIIVLCVVGFLITIISNG